VGIISGQWIPRRVVWGFTARVYPPSLITICCLSWWLTREKENMFHNCSSSLNWMYPIKKIQQRSRLISVSQSWKSGCNILPSWMFRVEEREEFGIHRLISLWIHLFFHILIKDFFTTEGLSKFRESTLVWSFLLRYFLYAKSTSRALVNGIPLCLKILVKIYPYKSKTYLKVDFVAIDLRIIANKLIW